MASHSLPPDVAARIRELEVRVENLTRAQNPVSPRLFQLADVAGMPSAAGQTLEYNRATGQWEPGAVLSPGDIKFTANPDAPRGRWLVADGTTVSRTTYAELFDAIGTTYGAGDGSTTFHLPDLLGRFIIGASLVDAVADTGGSRNAVVGSHSHPLPAKYTFNGAHHHAGVGGGVAENSNPTDGASIPTISTDSAGVSVTNANLPPYIALWGHIRY